MSGPELKTCPFCGVRPHVHDDASHSTAFFADCYNDNCTVQPSAYGLSKAEAIAAWNTRAPVTVQDAARVVLENLDDVWDGNASTAMDNARGKAKRDGHKYRTIDREGFRAALRAIVEGRE